MVMGTRERPVTAAILDEAWKKWEGQIVDGEFPLRQYLGGCDTSAVFLTERRHRESHKAAIKLIPADSRNAQLQLSRWTEAAKLSHPHLIRLFQAGRCRLNGLGLLYVVMEYADENLSQVLPYRPLTPAEARDMLEPVLDALAYVHNKDFVHGRMKPANIMAVTDRLKISSDSLRPASQLFDEDHKPSVYDPPEISDAGNSPAGDVWSLGMTLVEALTQYVAVWERTEKVDPVLPQTLPPPFLDIAQHCLRRDPQRRWSVADIATRLQSTLAETPPPLQTTELKETLTNEPPRAPMKWRYAFATIVGALALAALLVAPKLLNRRSESPGVPAIPAAAATTQSQSAPESNREAAATPESTRKANLTRPAPNRAASPPSATGSKAQLAAGGDIVSSEIASRFLPEVSQKSLDSIRGTVRVVVRVHVDATGNVETADFDTPGPSQYFADHALQAAQRWKFKSPTNDGEAVPSDWLLRFEFTKTAVNANAAKATP